MHWLTTGTTKWTAVDHLGSPRVITDSNGAVVSRRDFKPFGEELVDNFGGRLGENAAQSSNFTYGVNDGVRQKFTGYQKDTETGLDFAEARMYENRHARFTAVDPLLASGKSANPQTFNRYVYVGNNPINITDPTGTDWYYHWYFKRFEWFDIAPEQTGWTRQNGMTSTFACICQYDGVTSWTAMNPIQNEVVNNFPGQKEAESYFELQKLLLRIRDFSDGFTDAIDTNPVNVRDWFNRFGYGRDANRTTSPDNALGSTAGQVTGVLLSYGVPKLRLPVNGTINIGGLGESGPASNVNILDRDTREGMRSLTRTIEANGGELIYGDGSFIGNMFEPQSAERIVSNRIVANQFDWRNLAAGAFRVLKQGGKITLNVWGTADELAGVQRAFVQAGFRAEQISTSGAGYGMIINVTK